MNLDAYKSALANSFKYIVFAASIGIIGMSLLISLSALNVDNEAAQYANEKQVELEGNNLEINEAVQKRLDDLVSVDVDVDAPTDEGREKNPFVR